MGDHPDGPVGPRKKFATPPVKIACLSCRASRTRCDGKKPCANCESKSRECVYRPSRRGGARIRKKRKADGPMQAVPDPDVEIAPQEPLPIENYVEPGAGLRQLPDWAQDSDFIYDSLFTFTDVPDISASGDGLDIDTSISDIQTPMVRSYRGDGDILDAYYIFIHPYFPILPAPIGVAVDHVTPRYQNQIESFEQDSEPLSPVALAISALLALIPCPDDMSYAAHESVVFRRKYAHFLAQAAIESIETESEIPDSSTEPQKALSEPPSLSLRPPFHPDVPLEFEPVIALDLLSVYEYAQRGNIKKMQSRAGQALASAMALSLHCSDEEDEFSEVRSRVWWMTYLCASQAAVVSNTKPAFAVFTPGFTTKYPKIQEDPEAFELFMRGQQAILGASQFVMELKKAMKAESADLSRIHQRMKELDFYLRPLVVSSDSWVLPATTTSSVDSSEEVVARALRCMTRIKLNSATIKVHRYCAFLDLPVFSTKHCDLGAKPAGSGQEGDRQKQDDPFCQLSPLIQNIGTNGGGQTPSSAFSSVSSTSPPAVVSELGPWCNLLLWSNNNGASNSPFSSHYSSKVCLKSALAVARAFNNLPYPNPDNGFASDHSSLGSSSAFSVPVPRMMPTFACCAMQCAYTLLVVDNRTKAAYPGDTAANPLVASLLSVLRDGLASISDTLENYAVASEALAGMRDQIRSASAGPCEAC